MNTVGWICALLVSLAYCSAATHPEHIVEQIADMTLNNPRLWLLVIAYFFVLFPASYLTRALTHGWSDQCPEGPGLPGAERWIGRLERFLIVSFLVAGQPIGIIVLVAVEAVFRYGQIRNEADPNRQRRLVEYFLVNGMLSYAIALSAGWLVTYLV